MRAIHRLTIALAAATTVSAFGITARASAQSIEGTWETSIPQRMSNVNGEETPSDFVPVTIVITQRGDSVFATWTMAQSPDGSPAKPRAMKGTVSNGAAVLKGEPTHAKINRGGDVEELTLLTTYTFKLNGDVLDGSSTAETADGSMPPQQREFKATRKK